MKPPVRTCHTLFFATFKIIPKIKIKNINDKMAINTYQQLNLQTK